MIVNKRSTKGRVDKLHDKLFFISICIAALGILMITSATYADSGMYYVKRQIIFVAAGAAIMIFGAHMDLPKLLYQHTNALYVIVVVLMLLLKTPLGVSSHGATRWIQLPFFQLQPVEIVKIGVIALLAKFLYTKLRFSGSPKFTVYCWMLGGIPAVLTYKISSDLSSAFVILAITFGLTFIFNKTDKLHLAAMAAVVGCAGTYIWYIKNNLPDAASLGDYSFRVVRIAAWLFPELYPDVSYQTQRALYGIGSGGFWGTGLGKMYVSIPEGHTDFIFALLVHQCGIYGGVCLILGYAYLLFLMFRIAVNACSLYETILVVGNIIHMATQVCVNIGVCTSLLPNTGLPLVLMSYGGSSILMSFAELAICASVSKKCYESR